MRVVLRRRRLRLRVKRIAGVRAFTYRPRTSRNTKRRRLRLRVKRTTRVRADGRRRRLRVERVQLVKRRNGHRRSINESWLAGRTQLPLSRPVIQVPPRITTQRGLRTPPSRRRLRRSTSCRARSPSSRPPSRCGRLAMHLRADLAERGATVLRTRVSVPRAISPLAVRVSIARACQTHPARLACQLAVFSKPFPHRHTGGSATSCQSGIMWHVVFPHVNPVDTTTSPFSSAQCVEQF